MTLSLYRQWFATVVCIVIAVSTFLSLSGCTDVGAWDDIRGELSQNDTSLASGRVVVTFDTAGIDEYLFDVPVPVVLDAATLPEDTLKGDEAQAVFYDETTSPYETQLPWECSVWNPSGKSIFWVLLPRVVPGETAAITMFIGPDIATTENAPERVWRNGYVAVLHFDDPSDPYRDSSPFENHGVNGTTTINGHTPADSASGVFGSAVAFVGQTDAIVFPKSDSLANLRPATYSMLMNWDAYNEGSRVISKGNRFLFASNSGGNLRCQVRIQHELPADSGTGAGTDLDDESDVFLEEVYTAFSTGVWRGWSLVWDGNKYDASLGLTIAGVRRSESSYNVPNPNVVPDNDAGKALVIGNGDWDSADRQVQGAIDELRISRIARSNDWITFQDGLLDGSRVTNSAFERVAELP
jgi:uncharacterized protein YceK